MTAQPQIPPVEPALNAKKYVPVLSTTGLQTTIFYTRYFSPRKYKQVMQKEFGGNLQMSLKKQQQHCGLILLGV